VQRAITGEKINCAAFDVLVAAGVVGLTTSYARSEASPSVLTVRLASSRARTAVSPEP